MASRTRCKEVFVAGVLIRLGSSISSATSCTSRPVREYVWDTLLGYGVGLRIRQFGSPSASYGKEDAHPRQPDTDSESNVVEAGVPWIAKRQGRLPWSEHSGACRAWLSRAAGRLGMMGGVSDGRWQSRAGGGSTRRVTAPAGPQLGRAIGTAWVQSWLEALRSRSVNGGAASARVARLLRPQKERLQVVTRLAFLRPAAGLFDPRFARRSRACWTAASGFSRRQGRGSLGVARSTSPRKSCGSRRGERSCSVRTSSVQSCGPGFRAR